MATALFEKLDTFLLDTRRVVLAIEGPCAAGKTTLAHKISARHPDLCSIFYMDDFFLRPHQRTPARLSEPGGNVDYERFYSEVVAGVLGGQPFEYGAYDCRTQRMRKVSSGRLLSLVVVEGVYSMHPYFGKFYDISLFMGISKAVQRERLLIRSPIMFDRFINDWIPKEDAYFEAFDIRSKCDIVI